MKTLDQLGGTDLAYLRGNYATSVTDLGLEITRRQKRLDSRIERQELDQQDIESLQAQLIDAQEILAALQASGVSAALIAKQQEAVNKVQDALNKELVGNNTLTDSEAQLVQMEIRELQGNKALREAEITAIDALIGT